MLFQSVLMLGAVLTGLVYIVHPLTGREIAKRTGKIALALFAIDQALAYLTQAYHERSGWMTYLNVDPRLDPLRNDARFIDLLHRVRLNP